MDVICDLCLVDGSASRKIKREVADSDDEVAIISPPKSKRAKIASGIEKSPIYMFQFL